MARPSSADAIPDRGNSTPDLGNLLGAVGSELAGATEICNEIQWLISQLLERAHHPDLPAELNVLQDIDRLQQELTDLSRLMNHLSIQPETRKISGVIPAATLTLESLRRRLLLAEDNETESVSGEFGWL